jgi:hypothetical protein
MFEGIVVKQWHQQQSYVFDRSKKRKSGRKWLVGLMHRLLNLGRNQWLHRNSTKHVTKRPWHQRAERLLNRCIIHLCVHSTPDLLTGDRHMAQPDLASLLGKSLTYRKQWYLNMVAAQQRCLRIRFQDPTYDDPLPDRSTGMIPPPSYFSLNTFSASNTSDCVALRGPQSFCSSMFSLSCF